MSELVPFFGEDEVLDDNLLRSIETLLDDNEQHLDGKPREKPTPLYNGMMNAPPNTPSTPSTPMSPPFQSMNGSFAFGNQVYQKWSTNESTEVPANAAPKRNFGRNNGRASHFVRAKKNPPLNTIAQMRANAQIAQYQAMLAERANQLLNQYLRLNYEFLNSQAQIIGVPLEQYVRNLLIALNNQSLLMPNQSMFAPFNPLAMTMPTISQPSPRAITKQYFNKKN